MSQKTGGQDLRVVKTRRSIEEAFLRLLRARRFNQITVQDVVDEALVNKGTFYRHYHDKYDLADQLKRERIRAFGEVVSRHTPASPLSGATMGLMGPMLDTPESVLDDLALLRQVPSDVDVEQGMRATVANALREDIWTRSADSAAAVAWVITFLMLGYPEYRRTEGGTASLDDYIATISHATTLL